MIEAPSGLLVAAQEGDAGSVSALLRRHDDTLRLVPRMDADHGCVAWDVYEYRGPDQPAEFVLAWQTRDGMPLPLSSSLLEFVKQHDKNTRGAPPDPDAENNRLKQERAKDAMREKQAIAADHSPYVDRGRLSVSLGPQTQLRAWQRTRRPSRPQ